MKKAVKAPVKKVIPKRRAPAPKSSRVRHFKVNTKAAVQSDASDDIEMTIDNSTPATRKRSRAAAKPPVKTQNSIPQSKFNISLQNQKNNQVRSKTPPPRKASAPKK